jgi:hypothetical protein
MIALAPNAIEIIDRNLCERTCDVCWWTTDAAIAAAAEPDAACCSHAFARLASSSRSPRSISISGG